MSESKRNKEISTQGLAFRFCSLTVYRKLLEDKVLSDLYELIQSLNGKQADPQTFLTNYSRFYYSFIAHCQGSLREYVIERVLFTENPFAEAVSRNVEDMRVKAMETAVSHDLDSLNILSGISSGEVKALALELFAQEDSTLLTIIDSLPSWDLDPWQLSSTNTGSFDEIKNVFLSSSDWVNHVEALKSFHASQGSGIFCRYYAFSWESQGGTGSLRGIPTPDPIHLSQLIGYEEERKLVLDNTLHFLQGYKANNVLLYGDRGTGKSSTVKALLNKYWPQGLRLIDVPKASLVDFPKITSILRNRKQKFIIFVDDLAFEDNEDSYTALKAILEGGIESKPDNVLIYATSNRRHLIKEKFSDRAGLQYGTAEDEVRASDSIQEKLSLADRFGITVVFSSPDKKRYLQIVEGLAIQRGLKMDTEKLHREALKWELWYNGRSPRTARQFVDWLEGEMGV